MAVTVPSLSVAPLPTATLPSAIAAPVPARYLPTAPADAPLPPTIAAPMRRPPTGAASLVDVLDSFIATSRLYDGMTGRAASVSEIEEFRELATRLYLAPSRGTNGVSAAGLRRELTSRWPTTARRARVLQAALDLPKLTAEGIVRTNVRAPSGKELERSLIAAAWPTAVDGRAVADVVIVGGGPGGLSTALHAADAGLRAVLFEAGHIAQSFSDAGMRPVYRMRTPSPRNSLAQAPFSPPSLIARSGLEPQLDTIRRRGQDADSARFRRDRTPPEGRARVGIAPGDATVASARNELLQHFAATADHAAAMGSKLVERAPVTSWRLLHDIRHGFLYEVRTAAGHRLYARHLVLAQGQVGSDAEHGRSLDALAGSMAPADSLPLKDRRDVVAAAKRLSRLAADLRRGRAPPRIPLVHDGLLGMPEVRESLSLLPEGSRVAVVGSGESAAKAALDVLRMNPGAKVDLFVKDPLAAAQLQIPKEHATPAAIAEAHADPQRARHTLAEWKAFGTPITPDTLADIDEERRAGRISLHVLHGRFAKGGAAWVRRSTRKRTTYSVLDAAGNRLADIDGAFVWATGYDRASLRADPLTASLEAAGRLERVGGDGFDALEYRRGPDGLASAADSRLYVVGAQSFSLSADSAIPGIVARAARVAARIAELVRRAL